MTIYIRYLKSQSCKQMSSWCRKNSVGLGIRGYERPGFYSHWGVTFCHFFVSHSKDEHANINIYVENPNAIISSVILRAIQTTGSELSINISDIKLPNSKLRNVLWIKPFLSNLSRRLIYEYATQFSPEAITVWQCNVLCLCVVSYLCMSSTRYYCRPT